MFYYGMKTMRNFCDKIKEQEAHLCLNDSCPQPIKIHLNKVFAESL